MASRHGDQVQLLGRHHGGPPAEHQLGVVQTPEHLAEGRGGVAPESDEVVDELVERDVVAVLDVLLPVRGQLPGQVTGGEDDVHLAPRPAGQRVRNGARLVGGHSPQQLVGQDDRALPGLDPFRDPRPRAHPRPVDPSTPRHLAQVEGGGEVLVRPLQRIAHARLPERRAVVPQHGLQVGRPRLGGADVNDGAGRLHAHLRQPLAATRRALRAARRTSPPTRGRSDRRRLRRPRRQRRRAGRAAAGAAPPLAPVGAVGLHGQQDCRHRTHRRARDVLLRGVLRHGAAPDVDAHAQVLRVADEVILPLGQRRPRSARPVRR